MSARPILGATVTPTTYEDATDRVAAWAQAAHARTVFAANVHMVMEARDDAGFAEVLGRADLVTPDGVPLVWALRLLGARRAERVYGPDLMRAVCARAERDGVPVAFYGGAPATLEALVANLRARHPRLDVAYAWSPPFRDLTAAEDAQVVDAIARSGARIVFVGLGCPRQERWADAHRDRLPAVLLAVGAAFDFLAGTKRQAPRWMMRAGLEWLFRLATEPTRLWRRYLRHNPRFVAALIAQLVRERLQAGAHRADTSGEGAPEVRASFRTGV